MALIEIAYLRDPATGQVQLDANGYPQLDPVANASANTYAQLQARVQNEVLGSPQTSDVQNAISDAIAMHERTDLYVNSVRLFGGTSGSLSNLQTTQGKEIYSNVDLPILLNLPHISNIVVLAFSNRYPLQPRTQEWMDLESVSTTWQGLPTDFSIIEDGAIRIYPVPDASYPLIVSATIRFAPLVNPTDYSVWTNRAERLIRLTAKMLLFRDIIRDETQALVCEREVYGDPTNPYKQGELQRLKAESQRRTGGPGRLRPSRGYL